MRLISRARRFIDRLNSPISVEEYNQVIGDQNKLVDELTVERTAVRGIMLRTLAVHPAAYNTEDNRDVIRLAEAVERAYQAKTAEAIEAARDRRDVDAARREAEKDAMCLRERCDALEQGNAKLTATIEELEDKTKSALAGARHVIDQCEADRQALAKERDHAIAAYDEVAASKEAGYKAADRLQADLIEAETRIANAVDQLTGPREFAETKPVDSVSIEPQVCRATTADPDLPLADVLWSKKWPCKV